MVRKLIYVSTLASLLFACGVFQGPQPTPTKVAFENIDIQDVLVQSGDLPPNFEGGQKKYDWPTEIGIPMKIKPNNFIMQMLKEHGDSFNIPHFSMLALYDDQQNADNSYKAIIAKLQFDPPSSTTVGDRSSVMHYDISASGLTFNVAVLLFQRCNGLVAIRTYDWKDADLFAYAKGLNKRVEKIACQ